MNSSRFLAFFRFRGFALSRRGVLDRRMPEFTGKRFEEYVPALVERPVEDGEEAEARMGVSVCGCVAVSVCECEYMGV